MNYHKSIKWRRKFKESRRRALRKAKLSYKIRSKNRQNNNRSTKNGDPGEKGRTDRRPISIVVAPAVFDIINNTEETLWFFKQIENASTPNNIINLRLDSVVKIEIKSILILISKIHKAVHAHGAKIIGSEPNDDNCREILISSGFFDFVHSKNSIKAHPNGLINHRKGKKVEQKTIVEMITKTTEELEGRRIQLKGIYRALVEAMANTRDHASISGEARERWWVSIYLDKQANAVEFVFVDNGVGIFESVKIKNIRKKFQQLIGWKTNGDVLKDILDGNIGSRTGLTYRGKGLPAIKKAQSRGQIEDLTILSNDTLAYVDSGHYVKAKCRFNGTLISWKVTKRSMSK